MNMLLPDVYHDRWEVSAPYGGLKGELAVFLALIAFSIPVDSLLTYLPAMFHGGKWQQYNMANGREWTVIEKASQETKIIQVFTNAVLSLKPGHIQFGMEDHLQTNFTNMKTTACTMLETAGSMLETRLPCVEKADHHVV
jgi:hypothetical protein